MILVKINRNKDYISSISMKGHAEYDQYGKDIVCSAASAIIIGGINAIAKLGFLEYISYNVEAGNVKLDVIEFNCDLNIVCETMEIQLLSIAESYPKYIQVQEV